MTKGFTVARIGCSGPVAAHFVHGFAEEGAHLRFLARSPAIVQERYPGTEVIRGSMLNGGDVARAVAGADAAFLVTPMGLNDDPASEIKAAQVALAGMRQAGLQHLVYTSCLGVDRIHKVGILDAKHAIEQLIAESGIAISN